MQSEQAFWRGQTPDPNRYTLIPRSLTFLLRGEQVLLLRLAEDRGGWAGHYNGIGGHIERGEDPLSAARREVFEETGARPRGLRLCGVVTVDPGPVPGVGLYVFVGELEGEALREGSEGLLEWVAADAMAGLPMVRDLSFLLPRALEAHRQGTTFSAAYRATPQGALEITLG